MERPESRVDLEEPEGSGDLVREAYSAAEVAKLLGISRNSVYALVRCGELPIKRAGGRVLVPRRQLLRWLSEQ